MAPLVLVSVSETTQWLILGYRIMSSFLCVEYVAQTWRRRAPGVPDSSWCFSAHTRALVAADMSQMELASCSRVVREVCSALGRHCDDVYLMECGRERKRVAK
jgi:hypothetical protein